MQTTRVYLVLIAAAALGTAAVPDLQAPGGGPIWVESVAGDRVTVVSDYWRLEFDLRNGGALDTIVFQHGSRRNLLVEPFHTYVDDWGDRNAPAVSFRQKRTVDMVRLEFSGKMGALGRVAGPVEFETVWTLSGFVARADHTIRLAEDLMVSTVGIASTALRADLDEFGLRAGPADDPDRRKQAPAAFGKATRAGTPLVDERHAPLYLIFFHRGLEGFDLTTASDLAAWESGLTGRSGWGRYQAQVTAGGQAIRVRREPLRAVQPVRIPKGTYTFSYYLGLPRIVAKSNRQWRHLSFGNHPWPSDQEVARWAEAGVNIVRLHNDYAEDGNFWHDGAWPPYDEKGIAEMRRVIAACHRHNIQVVPYFSLHEFHPQAQGYRDREQEWKRSTDQAGTVYHNYTRNGEYGAQMCPQSGWLERRKQDIERAYRELGFDGIYYDWVMSLACNNPGHHTALHAGADGVIDLLAWTRRLVAPKGTLILHLYGKMPSIAFENFADLVVNMEEISSAESLMKMGETPLVTLLAESIPRSPCPSYRRDRTRERNQNNIAQLVVQGMFPWSGGTGGEAYEETLKLFRTFRPYRLENYRFRDAFSGAVRTAWPDVYGAVYSDSDPALVVISNTFAERRRRVVWTLQPEALGWDGGARVVVKDTKTGTARTLDAGGLAGGALETELDGYEYRVFEIRKQP